MRPASDAKGFHCAKGEVHVWFPARNVFCASTRGAIDVKSLEAALASVDTQFDKTPGPFDALLDLSEVSDYQWDVRMGLFNWLVARRGRVGRLHVLATTPTIRLAAGVFKLALGDYIQVTSDPSAFDGVVKSVIGQKR